MAAILYTVSIADRGSWGKGLQILVSAVRSCVMDDEVSVRVDLILHTRPSDAITHLPVYVGNTGCIYLNGVIAGMFAQFFVFGGWLFSLATYADCQFASSDTPVYLPSGHNFSTVPSNVNAFNQFGLVFFAKPNGNCYWYNEGTNGRQQIQWYYKNFSPDWDVARGFGGVAAICGFIMVLYALSLTCSVHIKGARYFAAFFLCIPLPCFQALTFLAFSTSLCDDLGCKFDRSAAFCVVAAAMYFIGGLCFLFMSDYPGEKLYAMEQAKMGSVVMLGRPSSDFPPDEPMPPPDEASRDPELVQVHTELRVEKDTASEEQPKDWRASE